MKALNEMVVKDLPNAWGRYVSFTSQTFEIEESDVSKNLPSYLGRGQSGRVITKSDVGRKIEIYDGPLRPLDLSDPYRNSKGGCWNFHP